MNPRTKDTLEAMRAIIESAREATEKERERCIDIVIAVAKEYGRSPHASAALGDVAHKIKEGADEIRIDGVTP